MIKVTEQISISVFESEKDRSDLIYHINDIEVAKNTLTIPHPYTAADADFYFNLVAESTKKHGKPTSFTIRYEGKLKS